MAELKIGTKVDIVFENELNKSNAHYMKALVYDCTGDSIIISQTSPALNSRFLNRRVIVSFLVNREKRILRFGFVARLVDLMTDYKISSDKSVEALVLKQHEKPAQMDFRMHFRVKPPSKSNISMFFQEERANLIDISIGGVKFTYPKSYLFQQGDTINIRLVIDGKAFDLKAGVRNISMPHEYSANKTIQYVSVEFEHSNRQLETALSRAIIDIERQILSEGKII